MYFDGSFTLNGARGVIVLISPKGDWLLYVSRLHFRATNNMVKYEALVNGLCIAAELRVQQLYNQGVSELNINQVMGESNCRDSRMAAVDVSYIAPHVHGIANVALHRDYPPGIVFIFSQGRKDLHHV
jgi:ribonuclease HI